LVVPLLSVPRVGVKSRLGLKVIIFLISIRGLGLDGSKQKLVDHCSTNIQNFNHFFYSPWLAENRGT
jgi:hypothetical protein